MSSDIIKTGHRGSHCTFHLNFTYKIHEVQPNTQSEFIPQTATLLSKAFIADPTLLWILSLPEHEHPTYLPTYLKVLLTAATMNGASIAQIDDWKSCGVVMPAGAYVGNFWTAVQAGWMKVMWKLGWGGFHVC